MSVDGAAARAAARAGPAARQGRDRGARHEGTGVEAAKKCRGNCRNASLPRAYPGGMWQDTAARHGNAGLFLISCTRCDNVFVTCESGRPCESAFAEPTESLWEGVYMRLIHLHAVIFRKTFRTPTAFTASGMASGAVVRIGGSVQGRRGTHRLPAAPPSTPDDMIRRNRRSGNFIAVRSRRVARHRKVRPQDARGGRSGRPNSEPWPPQLSLQLAGFRDSFCTYMRVLSCMTPSPTAVPHSSI